MTKQTSSASFVLLFAVATLCACGTDPYSGDSVATDADGGLDASLPAALVDLLPADDEVETWARSALPISVDTDAALYDQIDGAAPKYIDRGWQRSVFAVYAQGGASMNVAIHDMGTPENAQAIFNHDLPPSRIEILAEPRAVVDMGLATGYRSQACVGQYYVEVSIDNRSDAALASLKAFTLLILQHLGVSGATSLDPTRATVNIAIAPVRLLDLVILIDNSASMAPKVAKLNAQFAKLITALQDPSDGTLPDLRVAIIDSDLGTGGAYQGSACGMKMLPDGQLSAYGDLGRFQMPNTPQICTFNDGAQFLEHRAGQPVNYTGDLSTVFSCLASNLGTSGCGEEHQLQAFEFALAARGVGNEVQQQAFLRRNAYLGLVFLSDEDDCSAAPNDGLFGELPEARGESPSLRCATRAHQCNGKNLTDAGPGYPTTAAFSAPLSACQARMGDECDVDTDTSKPTACNPLRSVKTMASEMKALRDLPEEMVFVAGIFGWPRSDSDPSTAEYKIAPVPNPNTFDTVLPTIYDSWPVCYDPDHLPSAAKADPQTGFDVEAAGWGATGGLRESAFIDEFGANGMKLSICERDFSPSMSKIGVAIARKISNLCIDHQLVDTDLDTAGVQADCVVDVRAPQVDPMDPTAIIYVTTQPSLPQCPSGASDGNVTTDCWQMVIDKLRCPVNGQLVRVLRTAQEKRDTPQLPYGTKLRLSCRVCPALSTEPGCAYVL